MKVVWANLKKLRFTDKEKINKAKRILFNIKIIAFIEPKLLKKFYKLLIEEYEIFFKYFEKNWISKKKLRKYTPIFNYYENLKGAEFDKKFLFLTNNISENINSILKSNFKRNYPNFLEWKNAILSTIEKFENSQKVLTRINLTSEIVIYLFIIYI